MIDPVDHFKDNTMKEGERGDYRKDIGGKFVILLMAVLTVLIMCFGAYADSLDQADLIELMELKAQLAERLMAEANTGWTGDMTVGANLTSGNTNGSAMSFSGEATQRVGDERYTVEGSFNYEEKGDTLTARKWNGSIQYDRFFGKTYALFNIKLQKDKFRNLNLRTTLGPGMGYQVSDSISLEGGLAYHNKDVCVGEDLQWTTARLGMNYNIDITDSARFSNVLGVNPSLKDVGEYTARNKADLIYAFSDKWSGKVTHLMEHDSNPSANVQKRDTSLTAGLQYNF